MDKRDMVPGAIIQINRSAGGKDFKTINNIGPGDVINYVEGGSDIISHLEVHASIASQLQLAAYHQIRPKAFKGMRLCLVDSYADVRWHTLDEDVNANKPDYEPLWNCKCVERCYTDGNKTGWMLPGEPYCPNDPSLKDKVWTPGDVIWYKIKQDLGGQWAKLELLEKECLGKRLEGPDQYSQIAFNSDRIQKDVIYVPKSGESISVVASGGIFCSCMAPELIENFAMGNSFKYCKRCKKERL